MAMQISDITAQRIVESIHEICDRDINFFREDGIICASTNKARIGDYHEIAEEVIRTGQTIEIREDNAYVGTRKGVNMPIYFHRRISGVVGISGEPDEVRKYAQLAQRIVRIILREQELESSNYSRQIEKNYLVLMLLGEQEREPEYLRGYLEEQSLQEDAPYRTILIRESLREQRQDLTDMEQEITRVLEKIPGAIYTFSYPERFLCLIPQKEFRGREARLRELAGKYGRALQIAVGDTQPLNRQPRSYASAQIALRSLRREYTSPQAEEEHRNYVCYDDMDLEILLGAIPEEVRDSFNQKVAQELDAEDLELLHMYFCNNRSLEQTAADLFIHKNTLQYKLNRIAKLTGYNPRDYRESVVLYLAQAFARYR